MNLSLVPAAKAQNMIDQIASLQTELQTAYQELGILQRTLASLANRIERIHLDLTGDPIDSVPME